MSSSGMYAIKIRTDDGREGPWVEVDMNALGLFIHDWHSATRTPTHHASRVAGALADAVTPLRNWRKLVNND